MTQSMSFDTQIVDETQRKAMWESHTMDENETTWEKTKHQGFVNFLRFIQCLTFIHLKNFSNCILIHFQTFPQPFKGIFTQVGN